LSGKARRTLKNFPGAEAILGELKRGPERKRVGLVPRGEGRGLPVRHGCPVLDVDGNTPIGQVTSGCPSPSRGSNIAMAYVQSAHAKPGTQLKVQVRNTIVDMEVTKMPFVPTKYYTPPKN
jgi:aminomethyltransferase